MNFMFHTRVCILTLAAGALFAQTPGDAQRGMSLFEGKGQCLTCHRVETQVLIDVVTQASTTQIALAEPFSEIWNLSKAVRNGEGWLLAGIQQGTLH